MAEVKIILEGWINADCEKRGEKITTASTVTLIKDGDIVAIVDPGEMPNQSYLIDALKKEELEIKDITHIFQTHYHVDHTRNTGMFPETVKVVNEFGEWQEGGDKEIPSDGKYSPNIQIFETPGHSHDGLTFLVSASNGKVAVCGDVFWKEDYPEFDEYASDMEQLKKTREEVLNMADYIIPGHGPMFKSKKS